MKMMIAMLLATAAGAGFAASDDDKDYQKAKAEAAKEYKQDIAKCKDMSGNAKAVCTEEARASRARAEADAVAEYKTDKSIRTKARVAAVEAEYGLARARCAAMAGTDKDDCITNARKDHALAIADARADRPSGTAIGSSRAGAADAGERAEERAEAREEARDDALDRKAMQKCEQMTGDARSACLVDKGTSPAGTEMRADAARAVDRTKDTASNVAQRAENATERAARRTDDVASNAAQRTENAAERAAQRTENAAERAADNTRRATANVGQETREAAVTAKEKTKDVAANVADKTERATERAGDAMADAALTTKVKSKLLAEENLKSLGIHVETENGVVMLSGFVNSKAEAQRAVSVAKSVKGVNKVESAIKVK